MSVAVTTAAGAGLTLPLVCATDAAAATDSTWNKVADCESNRNWNINTGNGYYGGLQFAQATWKAYGGTAFAARADLASRAEQVAIGEKVLQAQGPEAWPRCSGEAGLTRGGDSAAAPATPAEAVSKHHASVPHPVRTGTTSYRVVSGDTLSGIAQGRHIKGGWRRLQAANRSVVGDDPDLILPGQELVLPGAGTASGPERSAKRPAERPEQAGQTKQSPTAQGS
jgi:nucleoid-associated protein YgaU